jgi:hypothetical protein
MYLPSATIKYGEDKTDTSLKCGVNIQYEKDLVHVTYQSSVF